MDSLFLDRLEVWTCIGVPAEERTSEQRLFVSIELFLPLQQAGEADDVTLSVNYKDLADDIRALAKTERKTIEKFAEDTAQLIVKNYGVHEVRVTIEKHPFIAGLQAARVSIARSKNTI